MLTLGFAAHRSASVGASDNSHLLGMSQTNTPYAYAKSLGEWFPPSNTHVLIIGMLLLPRKSVAHDTHCVTSVQVSAIIYHPIEDVFWIKPKALANLVPCR